MKKTILRFSLSVIAVILLSSAYSQNVGINSTGAAPDASAMLDILATDKGVLIPRVQLDNISTAAPVTGPAEGLLIYNETGTEAKGYYYWDSASAQWVMVGTGAPGPYWSRDATNGYLYPTNINDNVGVGFNTPTSLLSVAQPSGVIAIRLGHEGGYNAAESGRLIFDEYADNHTGSDMCGFQFHHDGSGNDLHLFSECGAVNDLQTWERGGDVGINTTNPAYRFHVTDNSGVTTTYSYNTNASGTGLIGVGNNQAASYLTNGSGLAGSSDNVGVAGFGTVAASSGLYGTNNNTGTFGYLGNQNWGAYGDDGTGNAGALGGTTWAGYFWDDVMFDVPEGAGEDATIANWFLGDIDFSPTGDNQGRIGWNYYWYEIFANVFTNVSDRKLKKDIQEVKETELAFLMEDIEKLELGFYKYKSETDEMYEEEVESYRPMYHIGTFTDVAPDYIQNQTFDGIDIYGFAALAMAGVKYNHQKIQDLEKRVNNSPDGGIQKINDFGTVELQGNEKWVTFPSSFQKKLQGKTPVINITPNQPNTKLYITEKNSNGFKIINEGTSKNNLNIDWVAYAKVPLNKTQEKTSPELSTEVMKKLRVPEEEKARVKEYWKNAREKSRSQLKSRSAEKPSLNNFKQTSPEKENESENEENQGNSEDK